MNIELILIKMYRLAWHLWYRYVRNMKNLGWNVSFGSRLSIDTPSQVTIGNNVVLYDDVWMHIENEGEITIGLNSNLGRRCVISAAKQVVIGKNVLFGPNVFVSDHIHAYEDVSLPILAQGISKALPVFIGEGSWLGINTVILPGVTIGKHCVIGANSVVGKSIPDYCVAVGAPAKIVKQYDKKSKSWIKNKSKYKYYEKH